MAFSAFRRAARAFAQTIYSAAIGREPPARTQPPRANDNRLSVTFTHEGAAEYATIALEGQYLLAAYLVNTSLAPHRQSINLLVDFGSGAGKSTRAIAPSARPDGRVVGVDISERIIAEARALTTPAEPGASPAIEYRHINRVNGRETIPLDDGAADAVSTTIVLQEFQTEPLLRNAIMEMGRIAKPGAQLAAACVSDLITTEDYTTFTYTPFPDNATRADNIRKCQSTVSSIVWENDRHWSRDILVDAFRKAGWTDIKAEYPLAPQTLKPFPTRPEVPWKDETRAAPLLLITATKG